MAAPFDAAAIAEQAVHHATCDDHKAQPPDYSHDALALAFSQQNDGNLIYVPAWSQWLRWDACRWRADNVLAVFGLARIVCRTAATRCSNGKTLARKLAAADTVSAVERLARSDPRHVRSVEDFDADPWVLNTPSGVIDLQSGEIRPHKRDDMFTKVTAVAPDGDCPRWQQFLTEITDGDTRLMAYLQRMIGYTLSGVVREHVFAFLWGPGGNGKSVLLGTIAAMLGDYATTAMSDVFQVGYNDQHPAHIATLRGARMVVVSEVEEGRAWAEARIKSLTGGDKVSARVMRGNPFAFYPVFKLWIAGNHQPKLRHPDPAMRRRLHIVPLTFVPGQPDPTLPEALRAELPGILAWALEGCAAWQSEGLNPPPIVTETTGEYFAEQDGIAAWIDERCRKDTHSELPVRRAFGDWKQWATNRGDEPGSEMSFSREVERHFVKKRCSGGQVFRGVQLLPLETGSC
jgi:putative DNA primase/helicase